MKIWFRTAAVICLFTVQVISLNGHAQVEPIAGTEISYDYEKFLNLATQIQTNKPLYTYLNTELTPLLEISPEQQALFTWPAKSKGLSESQLVAIMQNTPDLVTRVEKYLKDVTTDNFDEPSIKDLRNGMKKEFQDFLTENPNVLVHLKTLSDPTQALQVLTPDGRAAIESVQTYVNHPVRLDDGKLLPPTDLQAEVIKFIQGARRQVWANFYDFDLMDVAKAFAQKATQGADVSVGVDAAVITARPEVKAVADFLETYRGQGVDFVPVSSVGLNHMKVIVRDAGTPNAAVMFLSGNLTQSCIGKEGDLKALPENLRPKESVPNANHAIVVKGALPAVFARHQLKKILKMKIRGTAAFLKGQAGFPIGGAYKFMSKPEPGGKVEKPWMIMSYSPNGGMGDINTDILKQVILTTTGPVRFLQFAFSSKVVTDALAYRIQNEKIKAKAEGRTYVADIGGLGDKTFALRDFSSFLTMTGLVQDKVTGEYSVDPNNNFMKLLTPEELEKTRAQSYAAPEIYGEKTIKIDGQSYDVTAKIHHKLMMIPDFYITTPGTSFNYSVNAESNNEQVIVMRNESVFRILMGALNYLEETARGTVYDIAMKRNTMPRKKPKTGAATVSTCEALF